MKNSFHNRGSKKFKKVGGVVVGAVVMGLFLLGTVKEVNKQFNDSEEPEKVAQVQETEYLEENQNKINREIASENKAEPYIMPRNNTYSPSMSDYAQPESVDQNTQSISSGMTSDVNVTKTKSNKKSSRDTASKRNNNDDDITPLARPSSNGPAPFAVEDTMGIENYSGFATNSSTDTEDNTNNNNNSSSPPPPPPTPSILNITSIAPGDGNYTNGQVVDILVTFDEAINTTSSFLTLDTGGTASYFSGTGTSMITYQYTVGAAENSADLNVVSITIGDAVSSFSVPPNDTIPTGQNLADNQAIVIDNTPATITNIVSTVPGDGFYTNAQVIDIILTFDEPVTTSTSTLTLDTAGVASYLSGSGSNSITYRYTVGPAENSSDLNVTAFTVGDTQDAALVTAASGLPAGANLADNQAIVIDNTPATITNITSTVPGDGFYTNGQVIDIVVTFDELINTSTSTLTLDTTGTATYLSGTGTTAITYRYTVGPAENSIDLNVTAFNIGDAVDIVSIAPNSTLPAGANLADNQAIVIDNTPATITNITSTVPGNGFYTNGQVIDIIVTFDELINTATSTLTLDTTGAATYLSGSGTSVITYRYTVGPAENSGDLNVTAFNVGDAQDAATVVPDNTLPVGANLADNQAIVIDNTPATITNIASSVPGDGFYTNGQDIDIIVTFDELINTSTSTLTLDTTGSATYLSGSGTSVITYRYTVGPAENSSDLNVTAFNVGDAVDIVSIAPNSALPAGANLADNQAIVIDNTPATITNIASSVPGDGNYTNGQDIDIIVTFDELINTATSTLTLDTTGTATYLSGSGTSIITYRYTVGPAENSSDLNVTAFNVGDAQDAATVAPDNTLPVGANLADNQAIVIDNTPATITNIASSVPGDGFYTNGQVIDIIVTFDELINTSTSTLTLDTTGTATYLSGSGTTAVTYRYTVGPAENSSDLNVTAFNVGDAQDAATVAPDNTLPVGANLADNQAIVIDNTPATITNIASSVPGDGFYTNGQVIDIIVTFDELINTSTSTLTLDTTGTATYLSGSGTTAVTYRYTVGPAENSSDLNVTAFNVGDAQDASTVAPDNTLPVGANLADNQAIVIDNTPATITNIASSVPGNGFYTNGQVIDIIVTFDELINTSTSTLTLDTTGTATYLSGSGTTAVTYRYTVGPAENSSDLNVTAFNVGDAQDASTVAPDNTLPVGANLADNQAIVIDNTPATITNIASSVPGNGFYTNGQVIDIIVTFDELINTSTSTLTLDTTGTATYLSGSGTTAVTYRYTVGPAENSSDLNVTAFNVGDAQDASTVAPDNTLPVGANLADNQAIVIDNTPATITNIASSVPGDGNYTNGQVIDIIVTFDELINTSTSTLTLDTTGTATYLSGSGTTAVTYRYTVGAAENSSDLNVTAFNVGDAQDASTVAPDNTLPVGANLADNQAIVIDNTPATITNIASSVPGDGFYTNGQVIDIIVTFDELINTSTSTLTLDTTGTATYLSGSGTTAVTYRYTVGAAENSSDLNVTAFNVGDAQDASTVAPSTALPAGANLADNQAIVIDNTQALITTITSTVPGDGFYTNGQVIDIIVTFDELINTSTSTLTLDTTGTATYLSGSGTSIITYRYTVGAGDNSSDLNVTAFNVGDAQDASTVAPDTTLPAGQNLADNQAIVIDNTPALITTITSTVPGDGNYTNGQVIDIIVTFDELINTSTSTLTLDTTGTATYLSGSGSAVITYRYTVGAAENSSDLNVTAFNVGDAQDASTVAPATTLPAGQNLADNQAIVIDNTQALITTITSTVPGDGNYTNGQVIDIIVTFDELINTSTSTLTLDTGGTASYLGGTGTAIITYRYTVGAGENSSDLNVTAFNVGDAADAATVAPDTTLPAGQNLADNQAIVIDNTQALITTITSTVPGDGNYTNGQVIDIIVTFDELINTSTSTLTLDTGGTASYFGGTGTTIITYRYTVGAGENSSDLNVTAFNVGDAQDAATVTPATTLPAGQNLADNQAIVIDNTQALITTITSTVPGDGNYTNGQVIDIIVTFDELINTSTSTLTLDTGGTASYFGGTGTTIITYRYTVGAGENSSDLNVTAFNVGDAQDASTVAPDTTLPAGQNLADNQAIVIDNTQALITTITSTVPGDGNYTNGQVIDIIVTFDELINTSTSSLTLDTGGTASYFGGTGTTIITYRYTVGAGENSSDLNVTAFNVGDSQDAATVAPATTLPAGQNLADNQAIVIDNTQALITTITSTVPGDGNYTNGQVIDIIVTFDELINTSTSSLTLDTGGTASYLGGTGTTIITYRYTVGAGENSSDLNVTAFNVGDSQDAATVAPATTLPAGQNLADNQAIVIDNTQALITTITSTVPGDGNYTNGQVIDIIVTFDEAITTSTSTLTLDTTGTATYFSGSGTTAVTYRYTVGAGENSSDLNVTAFNVGDSQDAATVAPATTLPAGQNLADNQAIVIDNTQALITTITSTVPGDGNYTNGQVIDIIVTFDEAITTSTSTLTLDTTGTASYLSGSGTTAVTYRYTVGAGENSSDLNVTAFNVGDSQDAATVAPATTLPAGQNLADNQAIVIDNTQALITTITSTVPGDGNYTNGQVIDIIVTFDELINTSTSSLTLDTTGTATYLSGSGTTAVTYRYTVGAGENSSDLNVTAFNVGDAQDASTVAPATTLPAGQNLADNQAIVIDNTQATITNITSTVPGDGDYTIGQVIDIVVAFDELINTSTSSLTLDTGGTASYLSGSGTSAITYRYTVGAAENSSDLNVTAFNVGDALDAATVAPDTTLPAIQNLADNQAIVIDNTPATITNITSTVPGDGNYTNGQVIDIVVTFDEPINTSTSSLTLDTTGTATYLSGTGTAAITYRYTVGAGENSSDLNVTAFNVGDADDAVSIVPNSTLPAGQNLADNQAIVIDNTQALITTITSTVPGDGNYTNGQVIDIVVTFDEAITTSTSTLTLDTTGTASYLSGSGTTAVTYRYTVGAGENSSDLNVTAFNVGDSADAATVAPASTLPAGQNLADNQAIVIDNTQALITTITSTVPGDGNYTNGQVIDIIVTFDEAITTSTSTLTLDTTGTASYFSGSGTTAVTYRYTVGAAENSSDLNVTAFNVGDSQDASTIAPATTLPAGQNLADNQAIVIDNTQALITTITSTVPGDGNYTNGQVIDIIVTFDEAITTSTSTLTLDTTGTATYFSGSGTTAVTYRYTVGAAENSSDLNVTAFNVGDSADAATVAPASTLPAGQNLADNQAIVIDNTQALITTITSTVPGDGNYTNGQVIDIIVTFDEAITTSTSTLTLDTTGTATYFSGSGTTAVTYRYTVGAAENSSDLNVTAFNVGDSADAATVAPASTLPAGQNLADNQAIVIDNTQALITTITSTVPGDGNYTNGQVIDIIVTFDEAITTSTSTLTLDTTGTATYFSGSGTTAVTYRYTVGAAENSSDLNVTAFNVGDAADAATVAPASTLPAGQNLADNQAIVIDNTQALITTITSTVPGDGNYTNGQVIDIIVTFDEAITTSTSTLTLDTTGTASYFSGSGTTAVTYRYTVGAGENSSDLNVTAFNVGDSQDASTVAPASTLPAGQNLADNQAIVIDNTQALITTITSTVPGDGNYTNGQVIDIIVTFDEAITTSTSTLTLDTTGTATYLSGSGTTAVTYRYTVGAGENSSDLNVTAFNVGDSADAATVAPASTLPAGQNLADNQAIVIDNTQALITTITSTTPGDGSYAIGVDIDIIVTFDEAITTSTSTLTLDSGGTASYLSGSGTTAVTYRYTVGAAESSVDLNVTAFNVGDAVDIVSIAPATTLPAGQNLADNQAIVISAGLYTLDVYVRPSGASCTASPDPSLCYTSLSSVDGSLVGNSFLSSKNLVAQDVEIIVHIQDDWTGVPDSSLVSFSGWTTDATHFITIQTEGAARHSGSANCATCYKLDPSVSGYAININGGADYTVIDGIILTGLNSNNDDAILFNVDQGRIKNTIIYDLHPASSGNSAIYITGNNKEVWFENVLIYGSTRYGVVVSNSDATVNVDVHIYNTIIDIDHASAIPLMISGSGANDFSTSNFELINSIFMSNSANDNITLNALGVNPDFTGSTNIITNDDTAQTSTGLNGSVTGINVSLIDAVDFTGSYNGSKYVIVQETLVGSEDYHLVDNAYNLALTGGVDLSASFDPDEDIDGNTITSWYHIGPDWIAATAAPVVNEVYITDTTGLVLKPNAAYGNTADMSFIVEFSKPINVTGNPELTHNASATPVTCIKDPNRWNALKCDYTVGATDVSIDLDYASTGALALAAGTITDNAGNPATLTLPTPGATYSASDDQAIIIGSDTVAYLYDDCTTAPGTDTPCYEQLDAWHAANGGLASKDLVTLDVTHTLRIKGSWTNQDPSVVDLVGWNADATHTLTITAEGAARHSGVVAAGNYILSGAPATGIIVASSDYTTLDGFVIDGSNINGTSDEGIRANGGNEFTVQNMIISNFAGAYGQADGIHIPASANNTNINIYNTIFYNINRSAIAIQGNVSNVNVKVYNVTASNIRQGNPGGGTAYPSIGFHNLDGSQNYTGSVLDLRNTYADAVEAGEEAFGLGTGLANPGSWHASTGNNISDDGTAPGSNSITNVVATATPPGSYNGFRKIVFTNITPGSENFHTVDNAYNLALGAGQNTTTTIPKDIDDAVITAAQHQVGADFILDTTAPVVTEVYITDTGGVNSKLDGAYGNTATMAFVVEFSQAINFTSATLDINSSTTDLTCAAHGSLPNAIQCDYTVGASDSSVDLDYSSTVALTGTITDKALNPAVLTLPTPGALYSASDNQNIAITAGGLTLDIYVRENCTGAPGTCFTSLGDVDGGIVANTFLTSKNLVAQDVDIRIRIDQAWTGVDTAKVTIDGYTTDATHFVTIQTEGPARHDGTATCANCYKLAIGAGAPSLHLTSAGSEYTVIDGLVIAPTISTDGIWIQDNEITIRNTILHDLGSGAITKGIEFHPYDNTLHNIYIENVLIYGEVRNALMTYSLGAVVNPDLHVYVKNTLVDINHGSGTRGLYVDSGVNADFSGSNFEFINSAFFGDDSIAYGTISGNPAFAGSNKVITSDGDAQSVLGLTGANSEINVQLIDIADFPGSYNANKYVIVQETFAGSEDFSLVDNAWNIAFGGVDLSASFDPDEDLGGEAITNWYHIGSDWAATIANPVVNEVYITDIGGLALQPNNTYGNLATMSFIVEFSKPINVTGNPQLTINSTATPLSCVAHADLWNALKCDYTVGATDNSSKLDYLLTSSLTLSGGTVTDKAGNPATLTLPSPGSTYSGSGNQSIAIVNGGNFYAYIRPDCSAVPLPGPCYQSLGAWDTDNAGLSSQNLVTQGFKHTVLIQGDWSVAGADTSNVIIDGWTTDASNFIRIEVDASTPARHNGIASTGSSYRIQPAGSTTVLTIGVEGTLTDTQYTEIDGLEISNATGLWSHGIKVFGDNTLVENVIVHDLLNAHWQDGIQLRQDNGTMTVRNSIFYNINGLGVSSTSVKSNMTVNVDNVTVYNACMRATTDPEPGQFFAIGPQKATTGGGTVFNVRNSFGHCLNGTALGNGLDFPTMGAGASWGVVSNNISLDGTAPGTNSIINSVATDVAPGTPPANPTVVFANLTPGSEDFHIFDTTFNSAMSNGVDLSGTFTQDIDGDVIVPAEWQIGADWTTDASAPLITNISSSDADGVYGNGAVIEIEVSFAEPVNTVLSSLSLDSGGSASYIGGTGTNLITYSYTVSGAETSQDLSVTGFTVADATDNAGNAALAALPVGNNLDDNKNIAIAAGVLTLDVYVRETTCASSPKPSLCFASLSLVDAGVIAQSPLTSKNLISQNTDVIVHIQNDWDNDDTAVVVFDGWISDSSRHLTIKTELTARHSGDVSCIGVNGCYRLHPVGDGDAIRIGLETDSNNSAFTILDGLIVTGTTASGRDGIEMHANGGRIQNTIIFGLNDAGATAGINIQSNGGDIYIENCLIYGDFNRGIALDPPGGAVDTDIFIHNTLVYGNGTNARGFSIDAAGQDLSASNFEIVNSAFLGTLVNGGISDVGGVSVNPTYVGSTNVLTKDNSAQTLALLDNTNSAINVLITDSSPGTFDGNQYVIVNNLTPGLEDFHLTNDAFNLALGGGVNNTANIPNDIDNEVITGTENQIGPDYTTDNTSPVVTKVYITENDGVTPKGPATYGLGETMSFIIEFSQLIKVTGTPQLTIDNGANSVLDCAFHTGLWNALKCDYEVATGESSGDLDYLNNVALVLNSGTILDMANNAAILMLPNPGAMYSPSNSQDVVINSPTATVAITSAPAINDDNKLAYTVSGDCSINGTANVNVDVGGVSENVDCSAGTFSSTLNVNALVDAKITCPADFVLVERNTKYTKEKFCVARYEMKNVGGVATSQPALAPWDNISKDNAEAECLALGGTFDLISNSQWQTLAISVELNPENWYGGVIGTNGISLGHSDSAPNSTIAVSNVQDPYDGTGNNSGEAFSAGWEQKRTHKLSSGVEIWDIGGNVTEFVKDVQPDAFGTGFPYLININDGTHPYTMDLSSGFADVSETRTFINQFGYSGTYAGLSGPSSSGYLGRLFPDNLSGSNALNRGGIFSQIGNGIFSVGSDFDTTTGSNYHGFRCISQVSSGYLAQATHYTDADSVTVSKGTTDPAQPTITGPSSSATLTAFTQTFTGACDTGSIVEISGDILNSPVSRECIGGFYSIEVTFTAGDNTKNISISETDLEGNASTVLNDAYDVFATPPTMAITSSPDINPTNYTTYLFSGTCTPDNTGIISVDVGGVTASGINCAGGAWSSTLDVSSVPDGPTIAITADYGVVPSATASINVAKSMAPYDNGANLQFTNVLDTDGNDVAVTWTAFSDTNLTNHRLKTYTDPACSTGEAIHALTGSTINSDAAVIDGLADGVYWATVTAIDGAALETESACSTDFITINTLAGTYGIPTTGMELWIDADQQAATFQDSSCSTAVTVDGDPVGCTLDLSGNTNHGRQTTAGSRPTYKTAHQNSRNSFYFADDYLEMDNEANFDFTGNEFTIFAVFRVDSWVASLETVYSKGNQSFNSFRGSSVSHLNHETSPTGDPAYHPLDGTTAVNDATYRVGTQFFDAGKRSVSLDSKIEASGTAPETYLGQNDFPVWLGGDAEAAGRNLRNSYVAEFIIYNRKLSSTEITQVEGYLGAKWGTAFNPKHIPGLAVWFDSQDTKTLYSDSTCATPIVGSTGNVISCWEDKAHGNNATQATGGLEPTFDSPDQAVEFDGSDYLNLISDIGFPYGNSARTLYSTGESDTIAAGNGWIFAYGSAATREAQFIGRVNDNCDAGFHGDAFGAGSTAGCYAVSVWKTLGMTWDSTNGYLYDDGAQVYSEANPVLNTTASVAVIGQRLGSATNRWDGEIGDIILYDSDLSTTDRQKLEGFLACKRGTQANLPGGHPYLATCP